MTPAINAAKTAPQLLFIAGDEEAPLRAAERFDLDANTAATALVGGAAALRAALRRQAWDAVLYFHATPGITATTALRIIHDQGFDLPFIIIAAASDERAAIRTMRAGVHDVVSLDRLDRLVPAVEREIREAHHRSEHRAALEMIKESEARFRALTANLPGMVFHLQRDNQGRFSFIFVSEGCHKLFGVKQHELLKSSRRFFDAFEAEDRNDIESALQRSAAGITPLHWEGRLKGRSRNRWVAISSQPQHVDGELIIWHGIVTNISDAKETETKLQASREQLAELSLHLETALEQERERIARDIHDELGSILVRLKIEAALLASKLPASPPSLAEKSRSIVALLDQSLDTAQRVTRQLRPGILKEFGLTEAIRQQAEDFTSSTGITCRTQCDDEGFDLDEGTTVALFRIVQEALTNVAKHAHDASLVVVRLRREQGSIALEIRDNGRGISEADMTKPKSFGLRGIRERILGLAGEFEIAAAEQGGTLVQLRVPEKCGVEPIMMEENLQGNLF